jgi:uncharacterized protein YdeI (YjbR/CyaY-like superfamily)
MDDRERVGDEMNPIFFVTADEFVDWLEANHESGQELWIGYHKMATGRPSITHPEAVEAALCFGWIDGIRKPIDEERYKNRFTPRRKGSNWSAVNVRRIRNLIEQGLVRPAGLAAFQAARAGETAVYSNEQRHNAELDAAAEALFRANAAAWNFFLSQAAWYRHAAIWWVMSAKRVETRRRRLDTLVADSAAGRRVAALTGRKASRAKETERWRA